MFATILLFACRPTETVPQADSAPAEVAPCELAHPWEMGTAEDVELAAVSSASRIVLLLLLDADAHFAARTVAANGEACPTYAESEDGVTVTVSGDCTTEWGYVYAGSGTFTDTDPGRVHDASYDHFSFDEREVSNPYAVDAEGAWAMYEGGADFDLTVTFHGDVDYAETTATLGTTETYAEGSGARVGYVDVLSQPSSTATGDLCLDDQWQWTDACDIEPDGVETLWGTRRGTLTWDGSTACDGWPSTALTLAGTAPEQRPGIPRDRTNLRD